MVVGDSLVDFSCFWCSLVLFFWCSRPLMVVRVGGFPHASVVCFRGKSRNRDHVCQSNLVQWWPSPRRRAIKSYQIAPSKPREMGY